MRIRERLRAWLIRRLVGYTESDLAFRAAPGKTVSAQAYQQREYTEAQLTGISGDLLAEARRMRESAAAE